MQRILNNRLDRDAGEADSEGLVFKYVWEDAAKMYTRNHEWIEYVEGNNRYRMGITEHAQGELGDITHIEYPPLNKQFQQGDGVITIESVKTTADVYAPADGQLVALNHQVKEDPSLLNSAPETSWIIELVCTLPPADLLTPDDYRKSLEAP